MSSSVSRNDAAPGPRAPGVRIFSTPIAIPVNESDGGWPCPPMIVGEALNGDKNNLL
jgi:hypothetical protein